MCLREPFFQIEINGPLVDNMIVQMIFAVVARRRLRAQKFLRQIYIISDSAYVFKIEAFWRDLPDAEQKENLGILAIVKKAMVTF